MLTVEIVRKLKKQGVPTYKEICPPKTEGLFDDKIVGLIGQANRAIGNLNSYARIIPNPDLLIWPLLLKEALASSKIEGTEASVKDILRKDVNLKTSARETDVQEVINHREATKVGLSLLKKLPISERLVKQVHARLMRGIVRGARKRAGEFRQGQNAIATLGEPRTIKYLPPPPKEVSSAMHKLFLFVNDEEILYDKLVCCAFAHFEFEAIHPFSDGNGRTGRIINILFLVLHGLLDLPVLYLSKAIIDRKNDYYRLLRQVTEEDKWESWVFYMLQAVEETAVFTRDRILAIRDLMNETMERCRKELPQRVYSKELIELLFHQPYTKGQFLVDARIAKRQTAAEYLKELEKVKVLKSLKIGKETLYLNVKLYDLLSK